MKDEDVEFQQVYEQEVFQVEKDKIYAAIECLELGIEYVIEGMEAMQQDFGSLSRKDRVYYEAMRIDLNKMLDTKEQLRDCIRYGDSQPVQED